MKTKRWFCRQFDFVFDEGDDSQGIYDWTLADFFAPICEGAALSTAEPLALLAAFEDARNPNVVSLNPAHLDKWVAALAANGLRAENIDGNQVLGTLKELHRVMPPPEFLRAVYDGRSLTTAIQSIVRWNTAGSVHAEEFYTRGIPAVHCLHLKLLQRLLHGQPRPADVLRQMVHRLSSAAQGYLDASALNLVEGKLRAVKDLLSIEAPSLRLAQVLEFLDTPDDRGAGDPRNSANVGMPLGVGTSRAFTQSINLLSADPRVAPVMAALARETEEPSSVLLLYALACTGHFGAHRMAGAPLTAFGAKPDPRSPADFFRKIAVSKLLSFSSFLNVIAVMGLSCSFIVSGEPGREALSLCPIVGEQLSTTVFSDDPKLVKALSSGHLEDITVAQVVRTVLGVVEARFSRDVLKPLAHTETSLLSPLLGAPWAERLEQTWSPILASVGVDIFNPESGLHMLLTDLAKISELEPNATFDSIFKYFMGSLASTGRRLLLQLADTTAEDLVVFYGETDDTRREIEMRIQEGVKEIERRRAERYRLQGASGGCTAANSISKPGAAAAASPTVFSAAAATAAAAALQFKPPQATVNGAPKLQLGAAGAHKHRVSETATHYCVLGVYFQKAQVNAALLTLGHPVEDAQGLRLINVAYLLVGDGNHAYRMCFVDATKGPVFTPHGWFVRKLAKALVDRVKTPTANLPAYFL
jgi:hypothetical protein